MKTAQKNEKLSELKKTVKGKKAHAVLEAAAYFAAALILAQSTVLQSVSPFAVSLVTVSKKKNYFYSAAGAALGYLLFRPQDFARCAAAVLIAFLGALALDLADCRAKIFLPMLLSFCASAATGLVVDIKTGGTAADLAITAAQSILAGVGAFFFYRTLGCSFKRLRLRALPVSDLTCIIISASLLLTGLAGITIAGFSVARCAAVLLVLITVCYGSDKMGIMLALCTGFALSLTSEESLFLTGSYGFSALLACLFCPFGTVAAAVSFCLSSALFTVAAGAGIEYFAESAVACALLALCPGIVKDKLTAFFRGGENITPDGSLRQSLVMRLRFAGGAINYISESVNEVREKIDEMNSRRAQLADKENGFPAEELINERTNEIRMVAADQFFSISDMLFDLAREFDEAEFFDTAAAGRIRRALSEYEIYPKSISVIEDKYGRERIEILAPGRETGFSDKTLQKEIAKACSRYLDNCSVTHFKDETMITFTEKPCYSLEIGFAQHSAEGPLCGDTIKTVNDGHGRSVLIISDGMGQGGRAAIDGAMGAGLLSRLLAAGFGFDSALKVVNSALLVKSADESLATLDCACVDLFTGRAEIYKAGAPATYIVKNGKITKCELSSLPAGILRSVEFAKRTAALNDGDLIVMASDGISAPDTEILLNAQDMSADTLANAILQSALEAAKNTREDDMSVIAARLHRFEDEF